MHTIMFKRLDQKCTPLNDIHQKGHIIFRILPVTYAFKVRTPVEENDEMDNLYANPCNVTMSCICDVALKNLSSPHLIQLALLILPFTYSKLHY